METFGDEQIALMEESSEHPSAIAQSPTTDVVAALEEVEHPVELARH